MPSWNRTWYTQMNMTDPDTSSATNAAKGMFWSIKAALLGQLTGTAGPEGAPSAGYYWTCEGSSDSSTAGMDATDRMTSTYTLSKIVQASSGVHTWIVLKSPSGMPGGPYYLCLDYVSTGAQVIRAYGARAAFTGGSTSARPTSTKEWDIGGAAEFAITDNAAATYRSHLAISANGDFYMAFNKSGSNFFWGALAFVGLDNTRSGDTTKAVTLMTPFSASGAFVTPYLSTTKVMARTYNDGASVANGSICMMDYYTGSSPASWTTVATAVNAADSKADPLPLFVHDKTSGAMGVRGTMPDCWHTGGQLAHGSVEPASGDIKHVSIGQIMMPFSVVPSL